MVTTLEQAMAELTCLAEELRCRQPHIEKRIDYYSGRHRLRYASDEFRDYFAERFHGFRDNWCLPVVQAPAERMNVLGIRIAGETPGADSREADRDLGRVWRANDCERGSSEAFVLTLAASRAYALVWGNPDDEQTPRVTWEHSADAIVGYDPDTRRRRSGLKLWSDERTDFATLYMPDSVWKFQRPRSTRRLPGEVVSPDGGWKPRQPPADVTWPLPNPLGVVPLVELRNQTLLDDWPISDIDGVMSMQDAVNLTWAYLLNALDFASLPQRIITGAPVPKVPILDEAGQKVGERPLELDKLTAERILWVPGENVKTAEWTAANLDSYANVIERAVEHIAAQTRTPPHYLIGKLANLSADALNAAETGLVSKAGERITYVTPAIREVYRLITLAQGNEAKARAVAGGTVLWRDVQFRSLAQKVDALVKMRQIGFPMEWVAEEYGLEPGDVARVMAMVETERAADPVGQLSRQLGQTTEAGATP